MKCRFVEVEGLDMTCPQTLTLKEANRFLTIKNDEADMEGVEYTIHYELVQNDRAILRSKLMLPVFSFDWWEILEEFLYEQGAEDSQITLFADVFKQELSDESMKKSKKVKEPRTKRPIKSPKLIQPLSKKWLFRLGGSLLILLLLFIGSLGVKEFFLTELETPSYEELIDQEQFEEAFQYYPEEQGQTETLFYDYVLDQRSQENLRRFREFHKNHETTYGDFDLAVLENNYEAAVTAYEQQSEVFSDDSNRLAIAGYCFLKEGKLDEAKAINQQINSLELEKKIVQYEQLSLQIKAAEKMIEELQKEDSVDREKLEEELNDLFDLKEKQMNL
ncbi:MULTISPECIES: hypothetical protein [unclassified Enterococcus]|uniref:hypothetical protein n=1 Tax=unclassified Enterococcus TaxID=2608891 RepID=UPI003F273759